MDTHGTTPPRDAEHNDAARAAGADAHPRERQPLDARDAAASPGAEAPVEIVGRLRLAGEVAIRVGHEDVRLAAIEAEAHGGFRAPTGRVSLTLSGLLRDVRRLAPLTPAISRLVDHVRDEPDSGRGASLTLVATPALVARLRALGAAFPAEPLPEELADHHAYMAALLSLLDYEPEKVSVVRATWRP